MENIINKVGNTNLIELINIEKKYNLKSKIFAKLEFENPSGSVKDRTALGLIQGAEKRNRLFNDSIIIEPTSGNIGISLSLIGKSKGYKVLIVMPENMSIERQEMIKSYGAEIVLTDKKLGMLGSINKVKQFVETNEKYVHLDQFNNYANVKAHYITGNEIIRQLPNIDIFINGIGSGGTISGVGEVLKKHNENIKIIGLEPALSPLLTKGYCGIHNIQGIGANFIPSILNLKIIDEIYTVTDEEAITFKKELFDVENLFCGISSGANLKVAIDIAKKEVNKNIVIILPDSGDRYLSIE